MAYSVIDGSGCKCLVEDCELCLDTFCDRCKADHLLLVKGYSRSCIKDSHQPDDKGKNRQVASTLTVVRDCAAANCKKCKEDYLSCTECESGFELHYSSPLSASCIRCAKDNSRLYNQANETCLNCHRFCASCFGVEHNNCITCQAPYFLFIDFSCTLCTEPGVF